MTDLEALNIFDMIRAAYPGIYAKKARDEKAINDFIKIYIDNFGSESFPIVKAAVSDLIRSSKFPPNISEVVEQVERRKDLAEFEEEDALTRVRKRLEAEEAARKEEEARQNEYD